MEVCKFFFNTEGKVGRFEVCTKKKLALNS